MAYNYTLVNGKNEYTVVLDDNQLQLFERRINRKFHPHSNLDVLINNINLAKDGTEIEKILISNGVCDCCSLVNINLNIIKSLLDPIIRVLYKYPSLNSRLTFIGSCEGFYEKLKELISGNDIAIKQFKLQHILSKKDVSNAAKLLVNDIGNMISKPNSFMALYMQNYRFFDGILFDSTDMLDYNQYLKNLEYSVSTNFLNNACKNEKAIAYHEMGHALDAIYNISDNKLFLDYYNSLSKKEIKDGLSEYASTNPKEFLAEAFSEVMSSINPRPLSRYIIKAAEIIISKNNK